jgi:hypothetical protein
MNFIDMRKRREKLYKKWLVINVKLAYNKIINYANKSCLKNVGKYLRLNVNGTVEQGRLSI